jgi:hypothetical protein
MWNNCKHVSCLFVVLSLLGTHYAVGAVGDGDPNWNPLPFFPFDSDFVDDFNGPIDNDNPVTWHNTSWITMTAQEGSLILSDPPLWFEGFALGLIEVWKNGRPIMVSDTSIQAVIRLGNSVSFVGIYTNTQDGTGDGDAYVGNIFPDGEIRVGSFNGEPHSVNTPLDPVNSDVVLQFDTIGDKITLSAWAVDKPGAIYSVTWTDEQGPRPLGYMGLGVGGGGHDAVNGEVMVRSFQVSRVRPFFLEDFEDGDASDGEPVTWAIQALDGAVGTGIVSDGSYVLTTTGRCTLVPDGFDSIGDVSIRTLVRGLSTESEGIMAVAHLQPDGRSAYLASVSEIGHIALWYSTQTTTTLPNLITYMADSSLNPFEKDLNVQFDVLGAELSLTVWALGSPKPSQAQLTATAPIVLPPGRVGINTQAKQIAIRSFDAIRIFSPPIAHWRLDEVEGNIANDSAGTKDRPCWRDKLSSSPHP